MYVKLLLLRGRSQLEKDLGLGVEWCLECGIGDRGSGFGMGIIGSIGVWRFSIGDLG